MESKAEWAITIMMRHDSDGHVALTAMHGEPDGKRALLHSSSSYESSWPSQELATSVLRSFFGFLATRELERMYDDFAAAE